MGLDSYLLPMSKDMGLTLLQALQVSQGQMVPLPPDSSWSILTADPMFTTAEKRSPPVSIARGKAKSATIASA